MSLMWMVKALGCKVKNASRKLVLIKLSDNSNDDGICWPSIQHIASQCEMSTRTVQRHLKDLEKAGFIRIDERKRNNFVNQSNLYTLLFCEGQEFELPADDASPDTSKPPEANDSEGDNLTPPFQEGDNLSSPPVTESPPLGDTVSPRTCQSFEPVMEPADNGSGGDEIKPDVFADQTGDTRERFLMPLDWEPSDRLLGICKTQGVILQQFDQVTFLHELGDFRSYWNATGGRPLSQGQWEHKFAQQLKRALMKNTGMEFNNGKHSAKPKSGAAILAESCAGAFTNRAGQPASDGC